MCIHCERNILWNSVAWIKLQVQVLKIYKNLEKKLKNINEDTITLKKLVDTCKDNFIQGILNALAEKQLITEIKVT